jgi:hypothetical protein
MLVGERSETRLGEQIATRLGGLAPGKYKPVLASDVAAALVNAARVHAPGRQIIESNEIVKASHGA